MAKTSLLFPLRFQQRILPSQPRKTSKIAVATVERGVVRDGERGQVSVRREIPNGANRTHETCKDPPLIIPFFYDADIVQRQPLVGLPQCLT